MVADARGEAKLNVSDGKGLHRTPNGRGSKEGERSVGAALSA